MPALDTSALVKLLLQSSDYALDGQLKALIRGWSNPPKAIEVLEVVDLGIHGARATGIVIASLQALYDQQCAAECTSHEEVVKRATWRGS